MAGRLAGKVAIITGAAKGLGEADARLFAKEGARVILTDVDVARGEQVAADIGAAARFVRHDVRHEAEWVALIADVMATEGKLNVLVNNAGVVEAGTIEDTTEADYRFVMAVSADGAFWGCKHAVPAMRASGGGSIINMASIASVQGEPYVAAYCAAKGAVEALSRAVAVHCAQLKDPIRCNSVHPAGILTPMVMSMPDRLDALIKSGSVAARQAPANAGNRLGEPNDIAHTVVFLASDESRFISGQAIIVDNTSSVTQGAVPALPAEPPA